MGLPKIDLPLFELEVPSTGKKVKYRPFTVKEEKILLIAQESKDAKQIFLAIKQILNNCLQNVDIEKLAIFDLEYILLNIRAKSVNNEISFSINDPDTEEKVDLTINVDDIQIIKFPDHSKIIKVNDDIMMEMRYPSISYLENITAITSESESLNSIMKECINSISDGDQSYKLSEFSEKEVEEFIESLSSAIVAQIKKFFDTIPVMKYETTYTDKTGKTKTFVAQGVETFFT